jgi:hypothetical protein
MSKIFKAIFFCCSRTEEVKEEIEPVEKSIELKKTSDKVVYEAENKHSHRAHSEERPVVNEDMDSSESCSISSGTNH